MGTKGEFFEVPHCKLVKMSAWASLYSLGSSIIKRPVVWLLGVVIGVIGTVATGYVTDLFKPVETFISDKAAELSCRYRQKPIANESQFTILVSPLAHDPDGSHTEGVIRVFLGENGILVVPICESLGFDYSKDRKPQRMTHFDVRGT